MFEMNKLRRPLAKLDCLVLKMMLETRVKDIRNRVQYIVKACDELKESQKFKQLVESVLMIGNLLNNQNEDANRVVMVQAIAFDSFSSLSSTKGYDKKTSLLSYLEMILNEKLPGVFDIYDELPDLEPATHESFDGIRQDEDDLSRQLKSVTDELKQTEMLLKSGGVKEEERADIEESKTNLEAFASKAQSTVAKLHDDVEKGKEAYKQTLAFFCQDITLSSDDFFNYLTDFFGSLLSTHKKMDEMRARLNNKKKKEQELTEMKKKATEKEDPVKPVLPKGSEEKPKESEKSKASEGSEEKVKASEGSEGSEEKPKDSEEKPENSEEKPKDSRDSKDSSISVDSNPMLNVLFNRMEEKEKESKE